MSVPHDTPTPPDGTIRWYDPPIAFFGGTFAGIALTAVAGVIALVAAMHRGYHPDQESILAFIQASFWANHVTLILSDLGLVAIVWLVARRRIAGPVAHYFPPIGPGAWALALAAGVVLSIATNGGNELLSRFAGIAFHDSVVERALVPHGAAQFVVAVFVIALLAPVVEEFFFRGLFFTWLRQAGDVLVAKLTAAAGARAARKPMAVAPATQARLFKAFMWLHQKGSAWFAVLISALLFAAVHGQTFQHPGLQGWIFTAELFLAGIVLALFAWRGGSLRASFAVHAAFNATAIVFSALFP